MVVGGAQTLAAQRLAHLFGVLAHGGVDDARLLGVAHALDQRAALGVLVLEALDAQPDIGAVEAAHDHVWLAHAQSGGDLVSHRRRGGGRQRQHRRMPQRVDHAAQPQVVGAEVVTPLTHTVRLVHHEERRPRCLQSRQHLLVAELLRREEDKLGGAVLDLFDGFLTLGGAFGGVDRRRLTQTMRGDGFELVALERQQW